jgi:meckelin
MPYIVHEIISKNTKFSDEIMKNILLGILLPVVLCQQSYFIEKKTYADCTQVQFFDPATLTCIACPANSGTTPDQPNKCKCNKGFKTSYDLASSILALTCTECPSGEAVSLDGTACYLCGSDASLDASSGHCTCDNPGEVLDEQNAAGVFSASVACSPCDSTKTANAKSDKCVSCALDLALPNSNQCTCTVTNTVGDVCFAEAQSLSPETTVNRAGQQISSPLFATNLIPSYQKCLDVKDSIACNFLANLCVLQLSSSSGSACSLLEEVQGTRQPLSTIQSWREQLPWTVLSQNDYQSLSTYAGIEKIFDYQSSLNIAIATYSVNGTYLGLQKGTGGLLQLCKLYDNHLDKLWSFGAPVKQTCTIKVENLDDTKFLDLYLEDDEKLYPLPVTTSCDSSCSATVNSDLQYTRRIFTADTISNTEYARALTSLTFTTEITEEGKILPPKVQAIYGDVSSVEGASFDVAFELKYERASDTAEEQWKIVLGVLVGVFFFISLIPFISWNRRNGTMMLDGTMIIKFLLAILDGLAWAMFVTSASFAIYWFFAKNSVDPGQLPEDQSTLFITVTVLAFVFKFINVIHIVLDQSYADVFFIDWERERPIAEGDQSMKKTTASKISIWRTILAANEWSEIQTTRKTSITLQLFVVIFILEGR